MRPLNTKQDIKQSFFDKEQVRIFRGIRQAKPIVSTNKDGSQSSRHNSAKKTRHLGPLYKSKGKLQFDEIILCKTVFGSYRETLGD